ncbi:uncharacterized protein LOC128992216 [Macrosteles quadrilineatus]|uniref:uncharacterized protein LOC128992216 n=1 Tax=Macrosteles quadrilineatus TaxID=74068 RepID=UPI0023E2B92D|nr:uncharacterized protein LOC128992216 [Macrosteles quadrilineatus]XP_054271657.1 uncharacterized protein LOC128992216 [Macrosteles quadrilineatus]XP_054271658.1 uncharacterized protein LOC128992216 [Macrosteles quadrilineatus]
MAGNTTMSSAMSYAVNRTADSTLLDQDKLVEKIILATSWLNLTQAHLILLKEKLTKARGSKRRNQSDLGDCTEISQTFYDQVLRLWSSVHNYKIRIQNQTNLLFNALSPGIMGQSSANPEVENFRRKILGLGEKITPFLIVEMEGTEEKEQYDIKMMENQREMIKLAAEVGDNLEQAESNTHPREIQRNNEKLMKVKVCRSIINTFLARSHIDYEQNPDLLDLKIIWRNPISIMAKTL